MVQLSSGKGDFLRVTVCRCDFARRLADAGKWRQMASVAMAVWHTRPAEDAAIVRFVSRPVFECQDRRCFRAYPRTNWMHAHVERSVDGILSQHGGISREDRVSWL